MRHKGEVSQGMGQRSSVTLCVMIYILLTQVQSARICLLIFCKLGFCTNLCAETFSFSGMILSIFFSYGSYLLLSVATSGLAAPVVADSRGCGWKSLEAGPFPSGTVKDLMKDTEAVHTPSFMNSVF